MKHLFSAFLMLSLIMPLSFCQETERMDSTLALIAYWSKGDHAKYQVKKTTIEIKNGNTKEDSLVYYFNLNVTDSTESAYSVEWKFNDYLGSVQNNDFDIPLNNNEEQLILRYNVDELGTFDRITNLEEVKQYFSSLFSTTLEDLSLSDSLGVKSATDSLLNSINTEFGIQNILLKEIGLFHWPFGVAFPVYDTVVYESEYPTIFGGNSIKANGHIYFDTIYYDDDYFILINEASLDEKDSKQMVKEFLENIMANLKMDENKKQDGAENIVSIIEEASLDIYDYNEFHYDFYFGYPIYVYSYRETNYNYGDTSMIKKEILEIELIE